MKVDLEKLSRVMFWFAGAIAFLYFAWGLRPHTYEFEVTEDPFHAHVTRMSEGLDSCWLVVWEHKEEEKGHGHGHNRPMFLVKCDD